MPSPTQQTFTVPMLGTRSRTLPLALGIHSSLCYLGWEARCSLLRPPCSQILAVILFIFKERHRSPPVALVAQSRGMFVAVRVHIPRLDPSFVGERCWAEQQQLPRTQPR